MSWAHSILLPAAIQDAGTPGDASGAGATATAIASTGSASGTRSVSVTLESSPGVPLASTALRFWTRATLQEAAVDGGVSGLSASTNGSGVVDLTDLAIPAGPGWLSVKHPTDDLNAHNYPVTFI